MVICKYETDIIGLHSYPGIAAVGWRPGDGGRFPVLWRQCNGDASTGNMPALMKLMLSRVGGGYEWKHQVVILRIIDMVLYIQMQLDALLPTPETQITACVGLERGAYSSTPGRYDNSGQRLKLEFAVVHSRENLAEQFEYTLNCLCEYNNQTVLMDSTRGKPLHFQNNVPV